MEWNGMEWNGMEWNGMEWNGMEWSGMEWNQNTFVTRDMNMMIVDLNQMAAATSDMWDVWCDDWARGDSYSDTVSATPGGIE